MDGSGPRTDVSRLSARIAADPNTPFAEATSTAAFLDANPSFDLRHANIDALAATTAMPAQIRPTLLAAQRLVRRIPVGESVVEAILALVRAGRPDTAAGPEIKRHVSWGPGPRASQALMLASRARALIDGRLSPSIDDVIALAPPVLRHRMALNFAARADGITMPQVIERLIAPLR